MGRDGGQGKVVHWNILIFISKIEAAQCTFFVRFFFAARSLLEVETLEISGYASPATF